MSPTDKNRDIDGYDLLANLALNLRWSWNHATDDVWRRLNPELWEKTGNPWVVLTSASRQHCEGLLAEPGFRKSIEDLTETRARVLQAPGWFQQIHSSDSLDSVAYFSMEFMLSEALPIYSGGLGNVAGDQLKAASDLGVPVVAVGLLYQQGYFRQAIDSSGAQVALYPYNDPSQLPITPVYDADGEWTRIEIELPRGPVQFQTWKVQVGRVELYLLDSNDVSNYPASRGITSELYGGGPELRLIQEIVLGIAGWRLLTALGKRPDVCHLNEGHAAFAVLERARAFMRENNLSFHEALEVTRAGNLFTTHTAVAAGFDLFSPWLIEQYLGGYARKALGIETSDLMALGRRNPADSAEPFNMAYLAVRGCRAVNGVSRLHQEVSRQIFLPIFPRWPQEEVPVGHVTNGVHMPTWDSPESDDVWTEACSKDRWLGTSSTLEQEMRSVSDERLWKLRTETTSRLVGYVRERLTQDLAATGAEPEALDMARGVFRPDAITLGFARRFATYKRPNLLLHDPERLIRLLSNTDRPVQLVIAGKAHPADRPGQDLIREWLEFIARPEARSRVAFLSDYDMEMSASLVQGVDVWINTPRRPWEASGTSGMKVLVNGGLNLSELDGWWAEAYAPEVGWALGDGQEHGEDPAWDAHEAEQLYEILESQVIPEFYSRNESGIPVAWVERMRASLSRLTPRFSAERTEREYTESYYLPAAANYRKRAAKKGAIGKQIAAWRRALDRDWSSMHFGDIRTSPKDNMHEFEVDLYLGAVSADSVQVELFANGMNGGGPIAQAMTFLRKCGAQGSLSVYGADVPANRPASDYTARVVPKFEGVSVPLEKTNVLWQR